MKIARLTIAVLRLGLGLMVILASLESGRAEGSTRAPLQIITGSLPVATLGQAYHAFVQATGGNPPVQFFATPASVPSGLAILASGELYGTPLVAGSFQITVGVYDSSEEFAYRILTLVVQATFPGKVAVVLHTDKESYHLYDPVELSRQFANTGPPRLADFYLGLVTPSGAVFLFYSADPLLCRQVDPDDPSTFFPLERKLFLPSEIQLDAHAFVFAHIPIPLEPGIYYLMAALTYPDSTHVISNFATQGFSFF